MELKIKIFLLATFVCAFIGLYNIVSAEAPANKGESMPMIGGISVEAAEPNVSMPSPVHVFTTVQQAAEYMNITPQNAKVVACRL